MAIAIAFLNEGSSACLALIGLALEVSIEMVSDLLRFGEDFVADEALNSPVDPFGRRVGHLNVAISDA